MIHSPSTIKKTSDDSLLIASNDSTSIEKEDDTTSLSQLEITESPSEQQLIEDTNLYLSLILSMDSHQVIEIISVSPTQITPIPQVNTPIMGIYSWRGEILWIIDGSALLGDTTLCDRHFWSNRYSVFVVRESGEHMGIMVPGVGNLGKRSRFCSHLDPPHPPANLTLDNVENNIPENVTDNVADNLTDNFIDNTIICPPIVDLVDRISQLRHQLRATWN
jgi:hypothetical protein